MKWNSFNGRLAFIVIISSLSVPIWISSQLNFVPFVTYDGPDNSVTISKIINTEDRVSSRQGNSTTTNTRTKEDLNATNETNPKVLKVFLDRRGNYKDYSYSIFEPDGVLKRFGSEGITYDIELHNFAEEKEAIRQLMPPCLLVSVPDKLQKVRRNKAPSCRILMVNDEWCKKKNDTDIDVRFYYHEGMEVVRASDQYHHPRKINSIQNELVIPTYLPLGPRVDFLEAFSRRMKGTIDANGLQTTLPISQRKYVWNAIFTRSTSQSRTALQGQLNSSRLVQKNPEEYFIQIASQWTRKLNKEHLSPEEYAEVLMHSKFTLSPTGHNPECFRIFEAIEAGSIPIVVLDEEYVSHSCKGAFTPFLDAPIIKLNSWDELEERVSSLLLNLIELDRQQRTLQTWYSDFMKFQIRNFESVVISPRYSLDS